MPILRADTALDDSTAADSNTSVSASADIALSDTTPPDTAPPDNTPPHTAALDTTMSATVPSDAGRQVIRTLTLDRPEALNALTPQLLGELADELEIAALDPNVRVVVITGSGRAFSAGVDLKALAAGPIDGGNVSLDLNTPARRCTDLLSTMGKITIAKVNGFCFTGALELAIACDLMVTAEEAKLGDTHTKWGLRPTWGMSARLVRAVGPTRARELSFTARTISGREAFDYGLASHCVPLVDLDETVIGLARTIAANSADATAAYKDLYRNSQDLGLSEALNFEYTKNYPLSGAGGRLGTFAK